MPVVRISDELFKEIQKHALPLVDNFESALWKALKAAKSDHYSGHTNPDLNLTTRCQLSERMRTENTIQPASRRELTNQYNYRKPILQILVEHGGEASPREVIEEIERRMKSELKPGDYEPNRDGIDKWIKGIHFQRLKMVHEGLIRKDLRGIWGITEQGRQWLQNSTRS